MSDSIRVRPMLRRTDRMPEPPVEPRYLETEADPVPAFPTTVALCCFRMCDWSSAAVPTAPTAEADEIIARHLLSRHRDELVALGRLAEQGELL